MSDDDQLKIEDVMQRANAVTIIAEEILKYIENDINMAYISYGFGHKLSTAIQQLKIPVESFWRQREENLISETVLAICPELTQRYSIGWTYFYQDYQIPDRIAERLAYSRIQERIQYNRALELQERIDAIMAILKPEA